MKWVGRVFGAIAALVLLAIILVAGLPWLPIAQEQIGRSDFVDHLNRHEQILDPRRSDLGFELSAEDLSARYILLGEMHGYGHVQEIDFGLVTYLQNSPAPRWYLAELTPHEAMAVNEYVSGGSDQPLTAIFDRFADLDAQWGNQEFFRKLTKIRELNRALSPDRQVRFLGIDAPREGEQSLTRLSGDGRRGDLSDPSTAQDINHALLNIAQEENTGRYTIMSRRMVALSALPGWDDAKFMGLWGLFHTHEVPINGQDPLSLWLQNPDARYAGDVVTINTMCVGACYNMMPAAALPGPMQGQAGEAYTWIPMDLANPYFQRPKGIGDLTVALGDESSALYSIDAPDSPYHDSNRLTATSGYLAQLQPWEVDGTGAEAMDYVILFRGTPPLTPWRGAAYDISGGVAADYPALIPAE